MPRNSQQLTPHAFMVSASNSLTGKPDFEADGTADDAEIQAAVDALPSSGGTVLLTEGQFNLSTRINILNNNVHIRGQGQGATIVKVANSANSTAFHFNGSGAASTFGSISDMTIDGNKVNNTGTIYPVLVDSFNDITVRNIEAKNSKKDGIRVTNADRCLIIGCFSHDNTNEGIAAFNSVNQLRIEANYCVSNGEHGIFLDGSVPANKNTDITIVGNICRSNTNAGIYIDEDNARVAIVGNVCQANTQNSIFLNGSTSDIAPYGNTTDVTITGNSCDSNGSGLELRGIERFTINGNVVNNTSGGTGSLSGIRLYDNCNYGAVTGNTLTGNAASGIELTGKVTSDATTNSRITVSGNVCRNNTASGIKITLSDDTVITGNLCTDNATTGVQVVSGNRTVVMDNITRSNTTSQISDLATATIIRNNSGFVTENSGTGTINSGSTSATVTHGLAVTPTLDDISVAFGENPTNDPGNWWIDTIGATTFIINVRSNPGASNLDFAWRAVAL